LIVYKITNLFYGTSYIGKTVHSLERRWIQHLSDAIAGSEFYLHRAIRKYGPDSFSKEIICECDSQEQMSEIEKFCIIAFDTKAPSGYNMTDGGDGQSGRRHSQKSRDKIGEAQRGRKLPEEWRNKISKALTGIVRSSKFCKDLSNRWKGKTKTEEQRKKISETLKGRKLTEEHRKNIAAAQLGKKRPRK